MIIQFSASINGSRSSLLGGGASLMARNIITADDLHIDGIYWLRPYDMTLFGAAGAAVIAANGGYRYAWLTSSDHYDGNGWTNSGGIHLGWSNDVAIPPKHTIQIILDSFTISANSYVQLETPWLVYDPDSESAPFRLYGHAVNLSGNRQDTVLHTSANMLSWSLVGVSHLATIGGHSGYQVVYRDAADDYWSYGLSGVSNVNFGYWTSSDGLTFTLDTTVTPSTGDGLYAAGSGAMAIVDIGAQRHLIGFADDGQRVISAVPISATCQMPATSDGVIAISTDVGGVPEYPGPKYLQGVDVCIEDGIAHIFAKRGFFADNGLVSGASYANGGGYDDQLCDYYAYVIDDTAARASAPAGVRSTAEGGEATIRWHDALPQSTYRVYRDTDSGLGTKTLIGDVNGTLIRDTPGGTGTYYYEVVTLNAGSEEQSRVVAPYVSSRSSLANDHVRRVRDAGGDIGTIDLDHVEWAEDVLNELGLKKHLAFWVMPEFGHIKDGSNVLSKIFCLGTTLKPRGGDLTFATGNTTYSATAWNNLPGWASSSSAAQGYFGGSRFNPIRRALGLTVIGSIQKSNTFAMSLFGWGELSNAATLGVSSGSPASVSLSVSGTTDTHTTTIANSADHIVGGVISPQRATVYVEGNPGSGFARTSSGSVLTGQRGTGEFDAYFWATGSASAKYRTSTGRTFSNGSQFASRHAIFFTAALSDSQMSTLNTRLRDGP